MSNYNLLNTHLSIGKSYRPSPLDQIGVLKLTRYSFLSSVYILKVLDIPPHKLKDIYPVGGVRQTSFYRVLAAPATNYIIFCLLPFR